MELYLQVFSSCLCQSWEFLLLAHTKNHVTSQLPTVLLYYRKMSIKNDDKNVNKIFHAASQAYFRDITIR